MCAFTVFFSAMSMCYSKSKINTKNKNGYIKEWGNSDAFPIVKMVNKVQGEQEKEKRQYNPISLLFSKGLRTRLRSAFERA